MEGIEGKILHVLFNMEVMCQFLPENPQYYDDGFSNPKMFVLHHHPPVDHQ